MHQKRKRFLRKKAAIAKAKRYLNKLHMVRLKRNFDKFKNNSAKEPKKEKNKTMILTRKFLPCLDKYFKRIVILLNIYVKAIMKWKDYKPMKATLKNGHKRVSLEKGNIEHQFADQYDDIGSQKSRKKNFKSSEKYFKSICLRNRARFKY